MEFILPVVLVSFAITGTGDGARIRVCFPQIKEVKRSFIVWRSKSAVRKYGFRNPIFVKDLGDMLTNSTYAKMVSRLIETSGLDYLKVEGGEVRFNCSKLKSGEQSALLAQLVKAVAGCVQTLPELLGWKCLPACVGRQVWDTLDCDLVAVKPNGAGLVSYAILCTGQDGGIPITRCVATHREEVNEALDNREAVPLVGAKC